MVEACLDVITDASVYHHWAGQIGDIWCTQGRQSADCQILGGTTEPLAKPSVSET